MQAPSEQHTIHCSYLRQDCALTLRDGLREYYRANPTLIDPERSSDEGAKFFVRHDACHVIFGTTTGLVDEALTDTWTLLGSDVTLKQYAEFAKLNEAREVLKQIGLSGMAKASVTRPSSVSDEEGVELSTVVVRGDVRGRGVGTALVREAARFARDVGVGRVTLRVFAANQGAVSFWRATGFEARIVQMTGLNGQVFFFLRSGCTASRRNPFCSSRNLTSAYPSGFICQAISSRPPNS